MSEFDLGAVVFDDEAPQPTVSLSTDRVELTCYKTSVIEPVVSCTLSLAAGLLGYYTYETAVAVTEEEAPIDVERSTAFRTARGLGIAALVVGCVGAAPVLGVFVQSAMNPTGGLEEVKTGLKGVVRCSWGYTRFVTQVAPISAVVSAALGVAAWSLLQTQAFSDEFLEFASSDNPRYNAFVGMLIGNVLVLVAAVILAIRGGRKTKVEDL
jgi:hypothetical protein